MIELLSLLLAVVNILVLYPIGMPMAVRTLIYLTLKKNPEWLSENPKFKAHRILDRLTNYFMRLLSLVNIGAIIYYVFIVPSPDKYFLIAIIPMQISALAFLIFTIALHFFVSKKIPTPSKVRADLQDRRLSSYIHPWVFIPGYLILIAFGFYYGWAFMAGIIDGGFALKRIIEQAIGIIFTTGFIIYTLKRKYSEFDIIFGPGKRKYEIWMGAGILYYIVIFRFDRFAYDFLGGMIFQDVIVVPIIGLLLNGYFIYYATLPKVKKLLKDYGRMNKRTI